MKSEEQIREELKRHKQRLKENKRLSENEKRIHSCYIEALEWILK